MARSSDRWYVGRGYTHSIGFIESDNYSSLISNMKHGHRRVGWAGYISADNSSTDSS